MRKLIEIQMPGEGIIRVSAEDLRQLTTYARRFADGQNAAAYSIDATEARHVYHLAETLEAVLDDHLAAVA